MEDRDETTGGVERGEGGLERTASTGTGWKTAKICITIGDRNNYARNARERGGGIRAGMQMRAGGRGCRAGRVKTRGGEFGSGGNTARNADTRIRRRFAEAGKKTRPDTA